jgi:hypothetical protein
MKKSDMNAVEPAKTELEAPVQLSPDQLEIVAGGFMRALQTKDLIKQITTVAGNWPGPIWTNGLPGLPGKGGMSF